MSAVLGSVGDPGGLLDPDVESILEEKNQLISRQYAEIERLQRELTEVIGERDALLCEVSKFKFEREMTDLTRLLDDSFPQKMERPSQHAANVNQVHSSGMHGVYSSGSQTSLTTSYITGQSYVQNQNYAHGPYNSSSNVRVYAHAGYNQPQSYGTMVQGYGGQPQATGYQQNHLKKGPVRNGDVLKRCRLQTAYELSQDLLDKQIEMLERKYGGVKARNAALTIQRAFRRYTLLKKFAAITAMAKAEKRLSRKLQETDRATGMNEHEKMAYHSQIYIQQPQTANRPMPIRSMSLRERRHAENSQSPIPRSQSGRCEVQVTGHQHANHNIHQSGRHTPSLAPSPCNRHQQLPPSPCWESSSQESGSSIHYYNPQSSSPEHQECANHATDSATMMNSVKDMGHSHASSGYQLPLMDHQESIPQTSYKVSETVRKRQYRVGLNLFNKKPERGISYLIRRGFLENSPQGVARFLISRKGLSKQMIGEYLGNLQNPFNMAVLECFSHELDLSGMQVDVALRKFQAYFRMPGEAQKIERLMEIFSQRYCQCNPDVVSRLRSADTVFVLAFAIIMLNTDLHTPNLKPERRMRLEDFIKNLRGIDDCGDIDRDILMGIYERVKENEFKPGSDHVSQVMKVQATIVGKKPNMALPHRRLVCYCRLYEIPDIHKKERPGVHQREVFLFNDLLVVTKILSKKKNSVTYTFRQSFPLCGMVVTLFEVPHYPYGIRLSQRVDGKVLVTFNARNAHDRCKFVEDLRESISEMDEMETLRIETELERQKSSRSARGGAENRDSGVADVEICPCPGPCSERSETTDTDTQLKRSALSNSLLDIHEQFAGEKPQRRGSVGSLDSGMSISFQSTSASSMSQGIKHPGHPIHPGATIPGGAKGLAQQPSFLGGLFAKRERKLSQSEESGPYSRTTEV
ncbi:brefeldin-resistant Arf-GEF family protein schizo isoform X7 [Megachile rotundata]|uniref:brefeldin-resistant Arf-GEF family protein schizo isoform X7 n=1 Tax=Megachile rotundata TaxID=143995 RepID=UPI000614D308|nr:PREDICTED: IQ motif and SEC7 domain-containing protein 1 isoform X5 [Megachile rotundata]